MISSYVTLVDDMEELGLRMMPHLAFKDSGG